MMRLRKKVVTVYHHKSQVLKTASREATLVLELQPQLRLQLLLQLLLQLPLQGTMTDDAHSLSDHPCQSHPASDQSKPQSPSNPSSALAKQNSDTSHSMPTNSRLQHDDDGHRTDQDGAGAILQSSPESVHEPLLITSKRQVLPLSWSKACRRPGSPSMAQVSRGMFVIVLYYDCHHHHHQHHHRYCYHYASYRRSITTIKKQQE